MAHGFKKMGHEVTVLTPHFNVLPKETKQALCDTNQTVSHPVGPIFKKDKIYQAEIDGIELVTLEDTPVGKEPSHVNCYELEDSSKLYEDGILSEKKREMVWIKKKNDVLL